MTPVDTALEQLAPGSGWASNWDDVLARAEIRPVRQRWISRRLIVAFALLAAILVPLTATAASRGWWFFESGSAPHPTQTPFVVKSGIWDGHAWQLIAYPSSTDGLCFSITATNTTTSGAGGAMNCAPFAGVARTSETKGSPDMTITYLSGGATSQLPAYVAGPVIETATAVKIRLADGATLTTPTFSAQPPLDHVRFYATLLPSAAVGAQSVIWVAGLDSEGRLVACLAPATAKDGISPLNACQ